MSISKNLFFLIKKLDASEKRHFTSLSTRAKTNAGYLKLFKWIDEEEDYHEEKLKKRFRKDNFHSYKNQLYHLILKSQRLILFDKKNSPNYTDTQLMGLVMDIQILEQKGLHREARQVLKNARKKAEKAEKYPVLLILLKKELDFINRKDTQKMKEQMAVIFEKMRNCSKMIALENQYWEYYYEIALLLRNRGMATQKQKNNLANRVKKDKQLTQKNDSFSFTAQYLFYYIKSYEARFSGQLQEHHDFLSKAIQIWEKHKDKKQEEPQNYKVFLSNYINSCILVKAFEKMPLLLKKLEAVETASFMEEAETFINIAFYKLLYYLNTTDFNQSVIDTTAINATIEGIKKGLEKYQNSLPKSRELAFYYNVSIFFFLIRDYINASNWLDKILDEPKNEHRKDIVRVAHLLQMVYQLELGNTDTAESLCQSVARKFNRWGGVLPYEQTIIRYIKKLIYTIEADKKEVFQKFHETLQEDKKTKSSTAFMGLGEVLLWVEHKLRSL